MRSRLVREGSVGLLILLGLGVFGVIFLWLNRINAAGRTYSFIVEFKDAGGMQKGAVVQYRGVKVGNIADIKAGVNGVQVELDISKPDLVIPRDVKIEANQSGLISESIVEITPERIVSRENVDAGPQDEGCDPTIIVCDGSRLRGEIGISVDQLIRYSSRLSEVYSRPDVYENVNQALKNTSLAAAQVAQLTRDVSSLTKATQQQLKTFASAADTVATAANRVSVSTDQTINQFGGTAEQLNATARQFSNTAEKFSGTATEISSTANRANRLLDNIDNLVTTNRSSLVGALNDITATSSQLRTTLNSLSPSLNKFTKGQLLENLETLSANAAEASTNLRDVTKTLNDPNNLLVLQQTLDSARVTFENTQKITSDLDDLTGDPKFRQNLRELVNGLSGLVSSTEQMEQQVKFAATLDTVKANLDKSKIQTSTPTRKQPFRFSSSSQNLKSQPKTNQTKNLQPNSSSQEELLKQLREYQKTR
ncbi:ABC-type transport system involved in resistance to organic solvents, periplasmic component [Rivularia sp. PCC 7116]|uniref:MlaD family protein n=1 Tax=Rivularia sp. PCC 7116 TaxID=373994 RepID=UPI00029EEC23|nr:MlaD family protein [Rivularia sp. PCC 7116]AFY56446.1 ABC-type transport system involved in resistance to organic solvents, periplasmic component [Rivularia sp. PCC 7116]